MDAKGYFKALALTQQSFEHQGVSMLAEVTRSPTATPSVDWGWLVIFLHKYLSMYDPKNTKLIHELIESEHFA